MCVVQEAVLAQTLTKSSLTVSLRINDNLLKVSIVALSRFKCTLFPAQFLGRIVLSYQAFLPTRTFDTAFMVPTTPKRSIIIF